MGYYYVMSVLVSFLFLEDFERHWNFELEKLLNGVNIV